jgi:hypothetical protein
MAGASSTSVSRLRAAALAILILGLLAALLLYLFARPGADGAVSYQIVNGQAFVQDNSREMQQLARLGGQSAVMAFQLSQWFDSLWHGQRFAYTLAVLSLVVAYACWHIASLMAEDAMDP